MLDIEENSGFKHLDISLHKRGFLQSHLLDCVQHFNVDPVLAVVTEVAVVEVEEVKGKSCLLHVLNSDAVKCFDGVDKIF